jgi:hypothetical protein
MWSWGNSLSKILSHGSLFRGTKQLPWQPHKESPTLLILCFIRSVGLIVDKQEGESTIDLSGCSARARRILAHPLLTYIHVDVGGTGNTTATAITYFMVLSDKMSLRIWRFDLLYKIVLIFLCMHQNHTWKRYPKTDRSGVIKVPASKVGRIILVIHYSGSDYVGFILVSTLVFHLKSKSNTDFHWETNASIFKKNF